MDRWLNATENVGLYLNMNVACLYEANYSNQHVSEEMWEGTDSSPGGNYWIEEGMQEGSPWGSARHFFYARNSPTQGYNNWTMSGITPNLNQTYGLATVWTSGTDWNVEVNNTVYATIHYHS